MWLNFALSLFLLATRILGLKWGGQLFFHPDENNMAWAVEHLSWPDLNPKFFAYGQFPLYLVYFGFNLLKWLLGFLSWQKISFSESVYGLRFLSALFSIATVLFGGALAKKVFKDQKWTQIYVLFLIFTPGLIQVAHFGTTESLLTFVAVALAYFSLILLDGVNLKKLFWLALISAVGLSSKASAAVLMVSPIVSILLVKKTRLSFRKKVYYLLFYGLLTAVLAISFSPYLILNFGESFRVVKYETEVARGISPVFYTRQFFNTRPVIFQLTKIFPWVLGLPLFLLFISGLFWLIPTLLKRRNFLKKEFCLLLLSFLPWFLLNSFLFTKWVRFMTPILPFLVLIAVWFLKELKAFLPKEYFLATRFVFLTLVLITGLIFTRIYLINDIRISASDWLNKNVPDKAVVLSEAGNVVDIPVHHKGNFQVVNFGFYDLDEKEEKQAELDELLKKADYLVLPSRRIFANYLKLANRFPKTANFYRQLFSGNLGFSPLISFEPFNYWEQLLLGSDLMAEETWTVFDHPTIRLFRRVK